MSKKKEDKFICKWCQGKGMIADTNLICVTCHGTGYTKFIPFIRGGLIIACMSILGLIYYFN